MRKTDRDVAAADPGFFVEAGMDLGFIVNSALLGVGLAMDAFSVSLANGLRESRMGRGRMCAVAGVYAFFQFAMPMIGWVCVHTIVELFSACEKAIPYVALALLGYIGGKMIREGLMERRGGEEKAESKPLTAGILLMQGVATSIDALSVGFAIEAYDAGMAAAASLIIAGVTFAICMAGLAIGKKAGTRLSWRASVMGGVILIGIGLEILIKGLL